MRRMFRSYPGHRVEAACYPDGFWDVSVTGPGVGPGRGLCECWLHVQQMGFSERCEGYRNTAVTNEGGNKDNPRKRER